MEDLWLEIWLVLGSGATAAALLGAITFLFRNVLSSYLSEKFSTATQQKITQLEDRLSRERAELNDLRQAVLLRANNRSEKLLEKQIQGSEDLWKAAISNKKHAMASSFLKSFNIDEVDRHIKDGSVSELVDTVAKMTGIQKLIQEVDGKTFKQDDESGPAMVARPFVSPVAWALYSAHSSIIWHAVITIVGWKNGVSTKFLKNEELVETAKKALPHQTDFLQKYGTPGTYYLLEELEEALLEELKRFLKVGETDHDAIENAHGILVANSKVQMSDE